MLKVDQLTKKFGGLTAVNQVSFEVRKGMILGLIGPNGAGKTTCFNMIAGHLPPSSGTIIFQGEEIQGKKPNQICHLGIARSFQIVKPLRKLTVAENILVAALSKNPMKEAKKIAAEIIEFTRLGDLQRHSAGELSIGNLKRLEVARALATKPQLLLLDEPMGGLNPKEVDQAIELIRQVKQNRITIIIIEHIMKALMAVAEKIVVLNYGELIAEGKPEEISANQNVINAYLGDAVHA